MAVYISLGKIMAPSGALAKIMGRKALTALGAQQYVESIKSAPRVV